MLDEEQRRWIRWRLISIASMFTVLLPFVLLVLISPVPIAWFFEGGRASISVSEGGPSAQGHVDSIVHTAGLSDSCATGTPGSLIVFVDSPTGAGGRVAALGLTPTARGLSVVPMDLPEDLARWTAESDPVTARLALATDAGAAILPRAVREGMYWRISGTVEYSADLREAIAIAPLSVATESSALLAARTRLVARGADVRIWIDIRWLASRRGPMDLPVYCWN